MKRLILISSLFAVLLVFSLAKAKITYSHGLPLSKGQTDAAPYQVKDISKIIVSDANQFALDLYKNLSKRKGNVFFSPFSISNALAMTYVGARGETEKQMAQVLHFTLPQRELHPAFSKLISKITTEVKNKPYIIRIANALWGSKGLFVSSKFYQRN